MKVIKKVDILSVAKLSGVLVGGIYLVAGVVISIIVFILGIPAIKTFDVLGLGSALLATLLVAILMGAICFILGAIVGWLYNICSKLIGGIHFELAEAEDKFAKFRMPVKENNKKRKDEELVSAASPQTEVNHIIKSSDFEKAEDRDTFSGDNPNFLSS